jgi:mannose-6-phosphate isomerase-like protein (cupin superfamily)
LSSTPFHSHENEEEFIYILKGNGKFITEKEEYELKDNTVIFIKPGIKHKIENIRETPLWFIFVYSPPDLEKEINFKILFRKPSFFTLIFFIKNAK